MRHLAFLAMLAAPSCISVDRGPTIPVTPQRPRISLNTATTRAETLEVEFGVYVDRNDRYGTPTTLKYGLDHHSEVFLGLEPLLVVDRDGEDGRGFGDLKLGYRRRVTEQERHRPATAYHVAAKIPTANEDRELGTGETDLFGGGSVSWEGREWDLTGFGQLGLLGEVGDGGLDLEYTLAVAGVRPIDAEFSAIGELALVWIPELEDTQLIATLAGQFTLAPGLVVDAGLALGLSSDAPDSALLVGLTSNLGPQGMAAFRGSAPDGYR